MRNQFPFYKSFDDVYQDLSKEQKIEFIDNILDVQFLRKKIDDVKFKDSILKHIWNAQKHSLDKSIKGYLDSQKSDKIKNPFFGCYNTDYEDKKNTLKGCSVIPKEEVKEEVKGEDKEEGEFFNASLRSASISIIGKKDINNHKPYQTIKELEKYLSDEDITDEDIDLIINFIEYRDEMYNRTKDKKYGLKSYRAVQLFMYEVYKTNNPLQAFQTMELNEWATYKKEWDK